MVLERMNISAPGKLRQELGSALASLLESTQVQHGCLSCRLSEDWQFSGELIVEAKWETIHDLTRHLQSDTYKRFLLLMELSPVAPRLEFYMVAETRGLDLVEEARKCPSETEMKQPEQSRDGILGSESTPSECAAFYRDGFDGKSKNL
jgi:quinol monooxygenase YgiN